MRLSRSIVGRGDASAVSRVISAGYLGMGEETRELSEYLGVESWQVVRDSGPAFSDGDFACLRRIFRQAGYSSAESDVRCGFSGEWNA